MMEAIPSATLVKCKSSNSKITKLGTKSRKTSRSSGEFKNMESKKRGVYVEKWANSKAIHAEDNKRQAKVRALPKSRTETAKPASDEAKLSSFTRLLSSPDPALAKELYKPLSKTVSPTNKVSKQNSQLSNMAITQKNQNDIKRQRNVIERNKKQGKTKKFRSDILRQVYGKNSEKVTFELKKEVTLTSSNTLKLTRDSSVMSDNAHWSRIFPSEPQSSADKNKSQNSNNNYEITSKKASESNKLNLNTKKSDDNTKDGKDKNVYNFFIDLLETVCDAKQSSVPKLTILHSGDSSAINLEIEENVAQKLYLTEERGKDMNNATMMQHSNRYSIKDDDTHAVGDDQSQMLANYYNSRPPLIPQRNVRRPRKLTLKNTFVYTPKSASKPEADKKKKKPKKVNLLSLLKRQLSIDVDTYQEPENLYEALSTIARNKNKYRKIRFDTPDKESKSDYESVCRFKSRKVISPSTRLPRKGNVILRSEYDIINTTGRRFIRGSVASINTESNHSLEVYGFDYDETSNVEPELESEYSNSERTTRNYVTSMKQLNRGMKTITQHWKR